MVSVWFLHGFCMVSVWFLCGFCMVSVWFFAAFSHVAFLPRFSSESHTNRSEALCLPRWGARGTAEVNIDGTLILSFLMLVL